MAPKTVTKAQLLRSLLTPVDVEIPGKGTVRVRALSRAEVMDDLVTVDRSVPGAWEARLISLSLVTPALTDEEALGWRASSPPGEIEVVIDKLNELSGLTKDAGKEAWKEFESDPDAEFPVPAGEGPGDDGGAAAG